MNNTRPYVLSIAGFDPSGGAGVMADVKAMEANNVYGLGVCSAITFQNDIEFDGLQWIQADKIIEQIEVLNRRFHYQLVKIGLIENLKTLNYVVDFLIKTNPEVRVIWDPILKASAGFAFHNVMELSDMRLVMSKLALITPNREEARTIFGIGEDVVSDLENILKSDSTICPILMTGNHIEGDGVWDILFTKTETLFFKGEWLGGKSKHGTGCVLSSVIASELSKGISLEKACREAKIYVERFIGTGQDFLGFHNIH